MQQIKKIDIHAHVTAFPEYHPASKNGVRFCSAEELIKIYDELNIEKGVILPLASPEAVLSPMTASHGSAVSTRER